MKGTSFYLFGVRRLVDFIGNRLYPCLSDLVGDILINYAVFGLILLLFMRLSGKAHVVGRLSISDPASVVFQYFTSVDDIF